MISYLTAQLVMIFYPTGIDAEIDIVPNGLGKTWKQFTQVITVFSSNFGVSL